MNVKQWMLLKLISPNFPLCWPDFFSASHFYVAQKYQANPKTPFKNLLPNKKSRIIELQML